MNEPETSHIRLSQLSKAYREGQRQHQVLDRIDLDIERGSTLAIRGRSGSGKSTLLNLVGGIDAPDAGTVTIDGVNLTTLDERGRTLFRRRHIGFVYQAFNLIPTLTVSDNIRLVLELNRMPRADAERRIEALLDAVGLADRRNALPDALEALVTDMEGGAVDALVRQAGGTMLIATHSQRVADFCDTTLTLHGGRLEQSDNLS